MPPKEKTTSSITLNPGEQKMLIAVVAQMGDVPSVNFDEVAKYTGQKYGKNARSACKKLFEKLRASAGSLEAPSAEAATTPDASGNEGEDAVDKKTPVKAKKAAPNKVAKKGTAKAAAGPKKVKPTPKPKKKAVRDEEAAQEDVGDDQDDGKSSNSVNSSNGNQVAATTAPSMVSMTSNARQASPEIVELHAYTELEVYEAAVRDMTVEAWREWKILNPYMVDSDISLEVMEMPPTPRAHYSDYEA